MKAIFMVGLLLGISTLFAQDKMTEAMSSSDNESISSAGPQKTVRGLLAFCLQCHGEDQPPNLRNDLNFIKNYQVISQKGKYKNKGIKTIYGVIANKLMPPRGFDTMLDDCERDQILAVLKEDHQITAPNCEIIPFE